MISKDLLVCGILSSLAYIGINTFVPMQSEGYSVASQTVSELSAIGSPTRTLWIWLCSVYVLLFAAFGYGILKTAGGNRSLRIVGSLIILNCVINLYWPPMHLREALAAGEGSLTDTLHIVWAIIETILMMLMMGFGAAALGRQFRFYTITTMLLQIVFGVLTGLEAPNIATNLPTPMIGIWERINIGVFMIWVMVLAIVLLRTRISRAEKLSNRIR